MKYLIAVLAVVIMTVFAAQADDLIVGLGGDDVTDQTNTQALALVIEYHTEPFYTGASASYGFAGTIQLDNDTDVFVGAGLAAVWLFEGKRWFIEGSFMPGFYDQGSGGTDLGGNIQFRTLLGVGYRLDGNRSVSLAIDHKSNGDLEERNPGSETITVRYRVGF